MLLGSNRAADNQFEKEITERFRQPGAQQNAVEAVKRLLDTLAANMDPWKQIGEFKPGYSESNAVPELREKYVNMTMSGLTLIGMVAFHASKKSGFEQEEVYKKLAAIDWLRNNPVWQKTGFIKVLVGPTGEQRFDVTRSRTEIDATAEILLRECGVK